MSRLPDRALSLQLCVDCYLKLNGIQFPRPHSSWARPALGSSVCHSVRLQIAPPGYPVSMFISTRTLQKFLGPERSRFYVARVFVQNCSAQWVESQLCLRINHPICDVTRNAVASLLV